MVIGIDASSLTLRHPTGVQRYSEQIIRALLRVGADHTFRLYTPVPLPEQFREHQRLIPFPRMWTQARLPIELYLHKPDVFFQPSYMLPPLCPVPSVTTIHDLGFLHYPNAYNGEQIELENITLGRAIKQRAQIIVPSGSVRDDLLDHYDVDAKRVHVIAESLIPLPPVALTDYPEVLRRKRDVIILAVGRLEERKNTATLVKAFEVLCLQDKKQDKSQAAANLTLVLIGQSGHGAQAVFAAIKSARNAGLNIIHRGDASDAELAAWFSIAKVFVYPSLYEGFGLPILQAFAAGVPVVTSDNSSIPEVAGKAAMYVKNPKDEDELAAALYATLNNNEKSTSLVNAGKDRLKQFSWEVAAKKTLAILTKN